MALIEEVEVTGLARRVSGIAIGGGQPAFRAVKPDDEVLLRRFFRSISDESLFNRFLRSGKNVRDEEPIRLLGADEKSESVLLATEEGAAGEDVVGVGQLVIANGDSWGELALLVRDDRRGMGIGGGLLAGLVNIGRAAGLSGLRAWILSNNKAMVRLAHRAGFGREGPLAVGVWEFRLEFGR